MEGVLRGLLLSEGTQREPREDAPEKTSPLAVPSPMAVPSPGRSDPCESVPCRGTCLRAARDVRLPFQQTGRDAARTLPLPPPATSPRRQPRPCPHAKDCLLSPCPCASPSPLSGAYHWSAPLPLRPSWPQSPSGGAPRRPLVLLCVHPFLLCLPALPALSAWGLGPE